MTGYDTGAVANVSSAATTMKKGLGLIAAAGLLVLVAAMGVFRSESGCSASSTPPSGTEIFQGVVYGCERLVPSEEGSGAIHWVRVDLNAPGIELYVTPLDSKALEQGWQYRLRWVSSAVRQERLAVAVNGALFTSTPTWRPRLPGDLAKGVETVVSDHVVSHVWEHTYLLWFDDRLTPTLETSKPPSPKVLNAAKWGIGGQGVGLQGGKLRPINTRVPNSRTAIGIDPKQERLFLAVGEHVSPHLILATLARLGAKDGMLLDGGGSTSMAVARGQSGQGVRALVGGWRPVATHVGVRARAPASNH
jgi:hypothetical protein